MEKQNKEIPQDVRDAAKERDCNTIEYVGNIDGLEAYSIYQVDNGIVEPRGFPEFVLWDGAKVVKIVCDDNLTLSSRFQ